MCRVVFLARRLAECLGEPGNHLRVDRIVLGRPAGRQREAADPLGVDDPHLDAGLAQQLGPDALVAATCLHHRLVHLVLSKPANQLAVALYGVGKRLPRCKRANARIHLVLGDIDTHDNAIILCHHPLPSLRGSGSKPLQLFGLRKTPELSLALLQAPSPLGATGSVPATGGSDQTARSHILTDFPDTRARGRPGARCTRGLACKYAHSKSAHEHTGSAETLRPSPRNGFTAYSALSPVTGFLATVAPRALPQDLTPASGRQNHTPSPSASRAVRQRHIRVHRISPHVRDDREPPLLSGETGVVKPVICPTTEAEYFCVRGWTGFC